MNLDIFLSIASFAFATAVIGGWHPMRITCVVNYCMLGLLFLEKSMREKK